MSVTAWAQQWVTTTVQSQRGGMRDAEQMSFQTGPEDSHGADLFMKKVSK